MNQQPDIRQLKVRSHRLYQVLKHLEEKPITIHELACRLYGEKVINMQTHVETTRQHIYRLQRKGFQIESHTNGSTRKRYIWRQA